MANVYFFDVNFNKSTPLESYFIYVGDVEEFRQICDHENISDYGVKETGCYFWNDASDSWCFPTTDEEEKIMRAIEGIGGITRVRGDVFVGWNIIITLDTGEIIKTNSEPVEMNEVQEAINTMLKPSFFGKRIKKFEIVAE